MTRKLTVAELSDRLRVAPDTVREWAARGIIPSLRACPGGKLLFDPDDVEAALRRDGKQAAEPAAVGAEGAPVAT